MLTYRIAMIDTPTPCVSVTGLPLRGTPLAVRRCARGSWTVDHVPSGFRAVPSRVSLRNRREAVAFGRALSTIPFPWDAVTLDEFKAGMSRLAADVWERFAAVCDPYDRRCALRARVFVRASRYRGNAGFLVCGADKLGRSVRIFVCTLEAARQIASAVKAGGDYFGRVGEILKAEGVRS